MNVADFVHLWQQFSHARAVVWAVNFVTGASLQAWISFAGKFSGLYVGTQIGERVFRAENPDAAIGPVSEAQLLELLLTKPVTSALLITSTLRSFGVDFRVAGLDAEIDVEIPQETVWVSRLTTVATAAVIIRLGYYGYQIYVTFLPGLEVTLNPYAQGALLWPDDFFPASLRRAPRLRGANGRFLPNPTPIAVPASQLPSSATLRVVLFGARCLFTVIQPARS